MTTPPDEGDLTGEAPQPDGSEPPTPQTVEEVEALWRNRFSQRDRAHNAEVASLREQLSSLSVSSNAPSPDGMTPEGYKARYEQAQRELEQERQARAIEQRRSKYPALAEDIPADDPLWSAGRDETLARLNASLAAPAPQPAPTGPIDRNQPRRDGPTGPKDESEMTKDELLAELQRLSPAITEARKTGATF